MSYSFSVTADNKAEAFTKVEAELKKVVEAQPVHERDQGGAEDAAFAFIEMLQDPTQGEEIAISMSGSLSWHDTDIFTGAISAYLKPKA